MWNDDAANHPYQAAVFLAKYNLTCVHDQKYGLRMTLIILPGLICMYEQWKIGHCALQDSFSGRIQIQSYEIFEWFCNFSPKYLLNERIKYDLKIKIAIGIWES